mgnify:CR=1 FL=1
MIRLLIIADDFTGALDTAAQFSDFDIRMKVTLYENLTDDDFYTDILVVDTETRHMSGSDAKRIVSELVFRAVSFGFEYIFKKTDSVLRGNVGAELEAVLNACGQKRLHFVPAYPQTGRTTLNGIQYVNGVPIAESEFRDDPVDPVTESYIPGLLKKQTFLPITLITSDTPVPEKPDSLSDGILVYDADSQQQMEKLADYLIKHGERLMAGCAGMAGTLPLAFGLRKREKTTVPADEPVLVVCGSTNPVSVKQCKEAGKAGIPRFCIPPEAKTDDEWPDSPDADVLLEKITRALENERMAIVDVNCNILDTAALAGNNGISVETLLTRICSNLGRLVKRLVDNGTDCLIFIMGGDSLLGLARCMKMSDLTVLGQIAPGVVFSRFSYLGENRFLLSKSGSFGEPDLFLRVRKNFSKGSLNI